MPGVCRCAAPGDQALQELHHLHTNEMGHTSGTRSAILRSCAGWIEHCQLSSACPNHCATAPQALRKLTFVQSPDRREARF